MSEWVGARSVCERERVGEWERTTKRESRITRGRVDGCAGCMFVSVDG